MTTGFRALVKPVCDRIRAGLIQAEMFSLCPTKSKEVTMSIPLWNILDSVSRLGVPRRIDGLFNHENREYSYSAYQINPKVGEPFVRIDIRVVKK